MSRQDATIVASRRRGVLAWALVAASVLAASGCTVEGTATRAPIDYDTGKYATVPDDSGLAVAKRRAAVALGEYLPFRADIDKRYIRGTSGVGPLSSVANLQSVIDHTDGVRENQAFLFGFSNSGDATDPSGTEKSPQWVDSSLLRFRDAAAARAAVRPNLQALIDGRVRQARDLDIDPPKNVRLAPIAGLPAGNLELRYDRTSYLLVPHGADVLVSSLGGLDDREATALHRRALPKLLAASDAARGVQITEDEPRRDVFTLSVPFADQDDRYLFDGSVAGPHAFAHQYHDSGRFFDKLSEAGVDAVAVRATTLMRASSDSAARTLGDFFADVAGSGTSVGAPSPRDLPSATCFKHTDDRTDNVSYHCMLVHGRYFAETRGDELLDAQQIISAQYVILRGGA